MGMGIDPTTSGITDPAVKKQALRAGILELQLGILEKLDKIYLMENELK